MFPKRIALILSFMGVMLFISVNAYSHYLTYPKPEQCTTCHALDIVYQEWLASPHGMSTGDNEVVCFDCHVPGCFQASLLKSGEKKGFQVLGKLDSDNGTTDNTTDDIWIRLEPEEVCQRCHNTIPNGEHKNAGNCIDCHMSPSGLTTYRVHKNKPITFGLINQIDGNSWALDATKNNIAKYVTRDHRVHIFEKEDVAELLASVTKNSNNADDDDSSTCFIKAIYFYLR